MCVCCCSTVAWAGCGWVMVGMVEVLFDLFRMGYGSRVGGVIRFLEAAFLARCARSVGHFE